MRDESSLTFLHAFILGILEGLTEFIPVSSTGHLIVAGHFLNIKGPKAATFEIFIQLGAILAVLILYRSRFIELFNFKNDQGFRGIRGCVLLTLTTLPALILGATVHTVIKTILFHPGPVAIGLAIGGVAIVVTERFLPTPKKNDLDSLSYKDAAMIGLFQCLALWPGMSRSASTILGALLIGINRKTAVEYSFFAAVPVMFAAVSFDLFKSRSFLETGDIPIFAAGFTVSFLSAWFSIQGFIHLIKKYKLSVFGWYRIAVAPLIYFFMK